MINETLDAALILAEQGIPVFPCKDKRPVIANGFHGGSTDPEQLRAWFTLENDYQLAMRPFDAGCVVIDVDLGANENDYQQLPATFTVRTPSGGKHMWYRCTQAYGNRKWAKHIDVRNTNGYVIIPPSRGYIVENNSQAVEFPGWACERLSKATPREERHEAERELDLPVNIWRAEGFLRMAAVAVSGDNGDQRTFDVACTLRDLGVSEDTALELMQDWNERCEPPWDDYELVVKIGNAYRYAKSGAPGQQAAPDPLSLYPPEVVEHAAEEYDAEIARFMGREPDEDETLPDITFWDAEKMLPRMPCTVIIYGDSGAHKTNLALRMCFEAMVKHGARIRFAAGEGAHGVRKARVPAQAKARGLSTKQLRGRWRTIPAVPLLSDPGQVTAFIEAQKRLGPCDFVVIDTWSTAVAGEEDNASITAAMLTDNGAIGIIKRELGCLVLILDHIGKMAARGVRGSSAKRGNVDAVLLCEADKEAGTLVVTCEKMRDGPDGHSSYWRLTGEGAPVPERCDKAEVKEPREDWFPLIKHVLEAAACVGADKGVTDDVLLTMLEPDENAFERRGAIKKRFENAKGAKAQGKWGALCHRGVLPEGGKAIWLWYVNDLPTSEGR